MVPRQQDQLPGTGKKIIIHIVLTKQKIIIFNSIFEQRKIVH